MKFTKLITTSSQELLDGARCTIPAPQTTGKCLCTSLKLHNVVFLMASDIIIVRSVTEQTKLVSRGAVTVLRLLCGGRRQAAGGRLCEIIVLSFSKRF